MQISRNKTTATAITLFLMLTITVTLVAVPIVNAHTPKWTMKSYCYVGAAPDVVGVNQPVLIVFWLNSLPQLAVGAYGDRFTFNIEITKPDGSKEPQGPFTSDPVGGGFVMYTPTQIGKYTVIAKFTEHTYTGLPNPPDGHTAARAAFINDTLLASTSPPAEFTVQQEPIPKYVETPLPEGYWTRPVHGANRGWNLVTGNWHNAADNPGNTNDYSTGPESAHVMWTRPYWDGGLLGGQFGSSAYYMGLSYEGFGSPNIIINGRVYYSVRVPPRYGWYCLDLRTGEEIWWRNSTGAYQEAGFGGGGTFGSGGYPGLSFGQTLLIDNPNQHGGFSYLWSDVGGGKWDMFDAFSGNYICSIGNVTQSERRGTRTITTGATGTSVYGKDGSILRYNIVDLGTTTPQYYLQVWNTTQTIWYPSLAQGSNNYWSWRPTLNKTFDGRNGFSLNVSIPAVQGSILEIIENQHIIGGTSGINSEKNGTILGNLWALNLKPDSNGGITPTLLWNSTFTPPRSASPDPSVVYVGAMTGPAVDSENNVFLFEERVSRKRWCYSLTTLQPLWESEPESQWIFYGLSDSIYKGKLLSYGYSGVLLAYNITTGKILWNWSAPSEGEGETWYTHSPLSLGCIADGKIYLYSTEHSANTPLRRDANIWCVDTETGQLLWKIQNWGGVVVADGYLVGLNLFDNRIYCYGKGPSATAVSASPKSSAQGTSVVIEGTVTDQSAGAKDTPAISDADQEAWMEYIYQQRPIPTNAKGVEVTLDAIDPNNNYVHIGTATSDISGLYSYMFTPEVPGKYTIIATFAGSAAYGSSYAETAIGVDEAPPTPAAPEPQAPQPPLDLYIISTGIAIIIAVALATLLILRKKP